LIKSVRLEMRTREWLSLFTHRFRDEKIQLHYMKEFKKKSRFIENIILGSYIFMFIGLILFLIYRFTTRGGEFYEFQFYLCILRVFYLAFTFISRCFSKLIFAQGMLMIIAIYVDGVEISVYLQTPYFTLA
jgi:hypothetical protein